MFGVRGAAGGAGLPTEEDPQAAREVDYLKKVKRRGWKRAALAVLCTAAVLAAALALKVFVIGTPLQVQTLMVSSIREEAGAASFGALLHGLRQRLSRMER